MPETQYTFRNLDAFMGSELLSLQDEDRTEQLFACLEADDLNPEKLDAEIRSFLESLDWENNREVIAEFVCQILPLENLVPPIYKDWRPIIKEGLHFVICRLPQERLIDKIIAQVTRPGTALEVRFLQFIEQMPILQKLGQILARNQHLDARFRSQLILLENSIRDASPADIRTIIQRRLNKKLKALDVELADVIHSEASVSAVIRFRWKIRTRCKPRKAYLRSKSQGSPGTLSRSCRSSMDWPDTYPLTTESMCCLKSIYRTCLAM